MNSSEIEILRSTANYTIIAPMSMGFAIMAVIISFFILILVSSTKQLHTPPHLLTSNTSLASILYCIVQCNNYIYLLFIPSDINNDSCRWRGYFGYMSVVAVIYSYLLQAISRFIFTFLSQQYRWLISLKTHFYLIMIEWIIVLVVPLPSLVTKDIYYRKGFLCWVPKKATLHVSYTMIVYYLIPILLIISIYISIYIRIHNSNRTNVVVQRANGRKRGRNRDLEVFRNIMILFVIYILGAVPMVSYIMTSIEFFYSMGIVSLTLTVTIEKVVSLFLDRDIRNILKKFVCYIRLSIGTITVNTITPMQ